MLTDVTMPSLAKLRVDCVGSFLRPERLKKAYADRANQLITDEELTGITDESVSALIATEQQHGLPILTDGEYRRFTFMESFAEVAGMDQWRARWNDVIGSMRTERTEPVVQTKGVNPLLIKQEVVTERLRLIKSKPQQEYEFAQRLTTTPVKASLLNADRVLQSIDIDGSRRIYPTPDEFIADVVTVSKEIVSGLRGAGCQYVHIDAPGYTAYVDPPSLEAMRERGEDAEKSLARAIAADNAVIADFPDLTFGIHVCRGNRHSRWHREGAYDAIAEQLFGQLNHNRFLLEYDDERSGSFAPLRYVPRDKVVVLGLVTTKNPQLESKDELLRRIDEASRHFPVEQLALSPQCGFASDIAGNKITEDDQWRKIDLILEVAIEVWGRS